MLASAIENDMVCIMEALYDRQYLLENGWAEDEINTYLPILEGLNDQSLLELHSLCKIHMFEPGETVDREQAFYVLLNPHDTPKELLISAIQKLQQM